MYITFLALVVLNLGLLKFLLEVFRIPCTMSYCNKNNLPEIKITFLLKIFYFPGKFRREFHKSFCLLCTSDIDTPTPTAMTATMKGLWQKASSEKRTDTAERTSTMTIIWSFIWNFLIFTVNSNGPINS